MSIYRTKLDTNSANRTVKNTNITLLPTAVFQTHSEFQAYNHLKRKQLTEVKNYNTFATRLIEKGIDIVVVKELLGHADIKTTMMYVHSDEERKICAIDVIDSY